MVIAKKSAAKGKQAKQTRKKKRGKIANASKKCGKGKHKEKLQKKPKSKQEIAKKNFDVK